MKKILAAIIVLILSMTLFACENEYIIVRKDEHQLDVNDIETKTEKAKLDISQNEEKVVEETKIVEAEVESEIEETNTTVEEDKSDIQSEEYDEVPPDAWDPTKLTFISDDDLTVKLGGEAIGGQAATITLYVLIPNEYVVPGANVVGWADYYMIDGKWYGGIIEETGERLIADSAAFRYTFNTINEQYHVPEMDIPDVGQIWQYKFQFKPGKYLMNSFGSEITRDPEAIALLNPQSLRPAYDYGNEKAPFLVENSAVIVHDGDYISNFGIYGSDKVKRNPEYINALIKFAESKTSPLLSKEELDKAKEGP